MPDGAVAPMRGAGSGQRHDRGGWNVVSQQATGAAWWKRQLARNCAQPDDLHLLARQCEQLHPDEQHIGFEQVLRLLADVGLTPGGGLAPGRAAPGKAAPGLASADPVMLWVSLLADSGAYESAAMAIMPSDAVYSGGRRADGLHNAQVTLPGGAVADCRAARSQAMAWLAALLRALAHAMLKRY